MHTFSILAAAVPNGHIYFLSLSYSGSKNDLNIYNMMENQIHLSLNSKEYIIPDKGYCGLDKQFPNMIIPIKRGEESISLDEQRYNDEIAKTRIVVENAFACIKRFSICQHTFRG